VLLFLLILLLLVKFLGKDSPLVPISILILYGVCAWSSLSICVKRFHDLGMSGWWFPVLFFPAIGQIMLLFLLGGTPGIRSPNRYGPAPLRLYGN
jgi:uncharacterized membrane protein YhaH (DUF805 family)